MDRMPKIDRYFEDELRGLVSKLDSTDKVEVVGFMLLSFAKASRLYYMSIGHTLNEADQKIYKDLSKLKSALEMRSSQTANEETKDFESPNDVEFDQFVSDATIELYFLVNDIEKRAEE